MFVLMGHDGPGHIAIAEGKTKVRPLGVYHGKVGRGLSVEMSVKHGPVTLLSVVQTVDGKLKLLAAEGGVGARANLGDRQYEQPLSVPDRRKILSKRVECPWASASLCCRGRTHLRQIEEASRFARNGMCTSVLKLFVSLQAMQLS